MTTVIFYEKPGCANNARQKVLLAAAGHTVLAKNLLTEHWTAERLLAFFGNRPVAEWFNRAAPRVKSGELVPEEVDAATALAMMRAEPLLIRRPLIEADGRFEVGFDQASIDAWLGLNRQVEGDPESCPKRHDAKPCP
ncbi:MAG TPA: ArsC/Spx/MgsR family protein [Novimethylophilus sp.]|jgi:nitrogenase-associated protein|uniref:ArsC/Spx/MgsR family protein n=1 Tax=Novimethylophilus sp. TaxID=2137426 RepID=UPI002F3EEE13